MAGGMDLGGGGKGGRKSLDASLNLVPFIDLMAVTIVFLILNAVWTQLGRLQVDSGAGHDRLTESVLQPVTMRVTEKALTLSVGAAAREPIPLARDAKGDLEVRALVVKLRDLHRQQPEQSAITISAEDAVSYRDLVRLLDTVVKDGGDPLFPSVTVTPVST